MPLYFAYGRLMNRDTMAGRCPRSKPLGVAQLDGYRLIITREGVPSIVKAPMKCVHGVLWDVAIGEVPLIDSAEALLRGGMDKVFIPVRYKGQPRSSLVYVSRTAVSGKAHDRAVAGMMDAVKDWNQPKLYQDEVAKLLD
ncbi:gamma-glutamylcyclotransferase family protein [Polycladidibacter stylochi]|uniref:gamma-glutamylcyclotransferase family protein n=1 Tax=Polycladidibacter stylochi TaxID=1807766 RepID=UPI000831863B|nr:gamma-glutamylcyclotransferase family protein [Pseudovibrio stylochi]